jgi:hypothetical protein
MDARRHAPAAERNREPILAVLRELLPTRGLVLEIASGTGQHSAHFASGLPALTFQPTERDAGMHASIAAWTHGMSNVLPPLLLDVTVQPWPVGELDAIFNANMIHIAPWAVCLALLDGAARHLRPGCRLLTYGPYRIDGRHTSDSNAAFDRQLKLQNPDWGVRDLEAVCEAADRVGIHFERRVTMPANNQVIVFRR